MASNILKIRTGHVCAQEASLSEKGRRIQEIFQELNNIFQELSIASFLSQFPDDHRRSICRSHRTCGLLQGGERTRMLVGCQCYL